jgi:hypothetical protein
MFKILALLITTAQAAVSCPGTIILQPGSIIQYKNATGVVRPGMLVTSTDAIHWTLVSFSTSATGFHTGVTVDQSQTKPNTFAVISCQVPF